MPDILMSCEMSCRVYSRSLLRTINACNHLPFFKSFSNFVNFCPNFQIFCPFSEKLHVCPYFLEQALPWVSQFWLFCNSGYFLQTQYEDDYSEMLNSIYKTFFEISVHGFLWEVSQTLKSLSFARKPEACSADIK